MAKDFNFDYSQFERYVKKFEKTVTEFDTFLKQFLLEQAQRCVRNVKLNTPVDTGALRASWGIGNQKLVLKSNIDVEGKLNVSFDAEHSTIADITAVGDNLEVTIWNGMEYSSYVEYGHSTKGGGWVNGYFMLTVAINDVERAMPARFKTAFAKFMHERGVG